MKIFLLALTLTLLLPAASGGHPPLIQMAPLPGQPPNAKIKDWSRLWVLGEIHAPLPVVWVSPQRFSVPGFQRWIAVSRNQYVGFLAVARSMACTKSMDPLEKGAEARALRITQYSNGVRWNCVLMSGAACGFVSQISALQGFHTRQGKIEPIILLDEFMRCSTMGGPRHK